MDKSIERMVSELLVDSDAFRLIMMHSRKNNFKTLESEIGNWIMRIPDTEAHCRQEIRTALRSAMEAAIKRRLSNSGFIRLMAIYVERKYVELMEEGRYITPEQIEEGFCRALTEYARSKKLIESARFGSKYGAGGYSRGTIEENHKKIFKY